MHKISANGQKIKQYFLPSDGQGIGLDTEEDYIYYRPSPLGVWLWLIFQISFVAGCAHRLLHAMLVRQGKKGLDRGF